MSKFEAYLREQWEREQVRRIVSYLVFGGITTVVNFTLYTLLTRVFLWGRLPSNITAVFVSVLLAYVTNKHFVFHSHTEGVGELLRESLSFFSGRAFTIALDIFGLEFLCYWLPINDLLIKAGMAAVIIVLNYIISKFLVFREKGQGSEVT